VHLHSDDPEAVHRFLDEQGIPAESRVRRLRLDRERSLDVPVWVFSAEELTFDLAVLPYDALRQAPLQAGARLERIGVDPAVVKELLNRLAKG
jgi:hypothetical protein